MNVQLHVCVVTSPDDAQNCPWLCSVLSPSAGFRGGPLHVKGKASLQPCELFSLCWKGDGGLSQLVVEGGW